MVERDFVICRYDPFVSFFRFAGPLHMLLIGGALLVLGVFVGRLVLPVLVPVRRLVIASVACVVA